MSFPEDRPRRLRRTATWRRLVRETVLSADDLIFPMFIVPGENVATPIPSMPGMAQLSADRAVQEARELFELGIPAIILFGIPEQKDAEGSEGYDPDGIVPRAIRASRRKFPICWFGQTCACVSIPTTGHCGVLTPEGEVDNDATLPLLGRAALAYAQAGADAVAPSDMMDGRVAAIRMMLDDKDLAHVPIVSYAAKYASGVLRTVPRSGAIHPFLR